jgi:hypothetical protein
MSEQIPYLAHKYLPNLTPDAQFREWFAATPLALDWQPCRKVANAPYDKLAGPVNPGRHVSQEWGSPHPGIPGGAHP